MAIFLNPRSIRVPYPLSISEPKPSKTHIWVPAGVQVGAWARPVPARPRAQAGTQIGVLLSLGSDMERGWNADGIATLHLKVP